MKTVVMGQNIVHKHIVNSNTKEIIDDNGETKVVFFAKPVIEIEDKATYEQICEFEGEMKFNSHCGPYLSALYARSVTIDGKMCLVLRTEFEVTTQTETVYTDKVISETDEYKDISEDEFAELLKAYNKQIIESDEKMLKHCRLYNLKPADTDCEELFKEVYPEYKFEIDDKGNLSPQTISKAQEFATSSTITIPSGKIHWSSDGMSATLSGS